MPWIEIVQPDAATGPLKDAYDWQASRRGAPSEFTMLGSLVPELVRIRLELYKASEGIESALTPRQRNIVGHVVSVLNRTAYCASQTRAKLGELGIDPEELAAIESGRYDELPAVDAAIARYAAALTTEPAAIDEDLVTAMRDAGLGDVEILHVNNQTAHLNYTNRVALGLGLLHEIDTTTYDSFAAVPK